MRAQGDETPAAGGVGDAAARLAQDTCELARKEIGAVRDEIMTALKRLGAGGLLLAGAGHLRCPRPRGRAHDAAARPRLGPPGVHGLGRTERRLRRRGPGPHEGGPGPDTGRGPGRRMTGRRQPVGRCRPA
ncbi:hypothetical protein [Streptomyces puniciscabiei]|uniref:hypothetical protein n=1 Tax=Streptomyces puniciscabiei TaxID=164348 RepID=UPI0037A3C0FD